VCEFDFKLKKGSSLPVRKFQHKTWKDKPMQKVTISMDMSQEKLDSFIFRFDYLLDKPPQFGHLITLK